MVQSPRSISSQKGCLRPFSLKAIDPQTRKINLITKIVKNRFVGELTAEKQVFKRFSRLNGRFFTKAALRRERNAKLETRNRKAGRLKLKSSMLSRAGAGGGRPAAPRPRQRLRSRQNVRLTPHKTVPFAARTVHNTPINRRHLDGTALANVYALGKT